MNSWGYCIFTHSYCKTVVNFLWFCFGDFIRVIRRFFFIYYNRPPYIYNSTVCVSRTRKYLFYKFVFFFVVLYINSHLSSTGLLLHFCVYQKKTRGNVHFICWVKIFLSTNNTVVYTSLSSTNWSDFFFVV